MNLEQTQSEPKKVKGDMSDNSLKNKVSMRWLIFIRYCFQASMIVFLFWVIIHLTKGKFISPEVTATLLGVTIGGALKLPFRSLKDDTKDNKKKKKNNNGDS